MAYENAVENISDLQTMTVCSACGKPLNLLNPYLVASVKAQRQVIERVDAALVGAEVDEGGQVVSLALDVTEPGEFDESRDRFYVGTRSGAADYGSFHNYTCFSTWVADMADGEEKNATPKIRLTHTDEHAVTGEES